jgi:hypothetical protein
LAYALPSVERPPTRRGSRRPIRFAKLEGELITPLRTGVLTATFRCAAPARLLMSGASLAATEAAEGARETLI